MSAILGCIALSVISGFARCQGSDRVSESFNFYGRHRDPDHLLYPSSEVSPYFQGFPQSQHYYPNYKSGKRTTLGGYPHWANLYKDFNLYRYGYDKDLEDFENYRYGIDKGSGIGYKSDSSSAGKYDNEAHKGHYNEEGAGKDGYRESSKYFTQANDGGKNYEGESHGESNGRRKGSKTTGYRKVYHKNEYKKDRSFHDEAEKRGHFNKYAHGDSYHEKNEGDFEKGGRFNYGFREGNQGENGRYDKGHYDANDSKFGDQQGKGGYQEDYSNYNVDKRNEKRFRHDDRDDDDGVV